MWWNITLALQLLLHNLIEDLFLQLINVIFIPLAGKQIGLFILKKIKILSKTGAGMTIFPRSIP